MSDNIRPQSISPCGNYAVQILWEDGFNQVSSRSEIPMGVPVEPTAPWWLCAGFLDKKSKKGQENNTATAAFIRSKCSFAACDCMMQILTRSSCAAGSCTACHVHLCPESCCRRCCCCCCHAPLLLAAAAALLRHVPSLCRAVSERSRHRLWLKLSKLPLVQVAPFDLLAGLDRLSQQQLTDRAAAAAQDSGSGRASGLDADELAAGGVQPQADPRQRQQPQPQQQPGPPEDAVQQGAISEARRIMAAAQRR